MYTFSAPFSYDQIDLYNSQIHPSTIHCKDNGLQRYFRKYLLQKVMSVFKWKLPDTWDEDYFKYVLYGTGYITVFNTDAFGVIPQFGTLGGYNVFYKPTYIIVSNPLLPSIKKNIGIDCEIIKFQPDYSSIMDIVNYYADLLALCSQSVSINLLNTHTPTIYPAQGKTMAESYKKMFDKVASGEPAVIVDKSLFDDTGNPTWTPFERDVTNLYISDKILSDMRKIEARFDTEVGIPNNENEDKKERLIVDEVSANNAETTGRAEMWLDELKKGCSAVKNMFGVSVSVDWRINPNTKGGKKNGVSVSNGSV